MASRALTDTEIITLFNEAIGGLAQNSNSTVENFHFVLDPVLIILLELRPTETLHLLENNTLQGGGYKQLTWIFVAILFQIIIIVAINIFLPAFISYATQEFLPNTNTVSYAYVVKYLLDVIAKGFPAFYGAPLGLITQGYYRFFEIIDLFKSQGFYENISVLFGCLSLGTTLNANNIVIFSVALLYTVLRKLVLTVNEINKLLAEETQEFDNPIVNEIIIEKITEFYLFTFTQSISIFFDQFLPNTLKKLLIKDPISQKLIKEGSRLLIQERMVPKTLFPKYELSILETATVLPARIIFQNIRLLHRQFVYKILNVQKNRVYFYDEMQLENTKAFYAKNVINNETFFKNYTSIIKNIWINSLQIENINAIALPLLLEKQMKRIDATVLALQKNSKIRWIDLYITANNLINNNPQNTSKEKILSILKRSSILNVFIPNMFVKGVSTIFPNVSTLTINDELLSSISKELSTYIHNYLQIETMVMELEKTKKIKPQRRSVSPGFAVPRVPINDIQNLPVFKEEDIQTFIPELYEPPQWYVRVYNKINNYIKQLYQKDSNVSNSNIPISNISSNVSSNVAISNVNSTVQRGRSLTRNETLVRKQSQRK